MTPLGRAILVDLLAWGPDRPVNIAERTGFARESVSRRFATLREGDDPLVKDKGHGVYELTDSGRDRARMLLASGFNPYHED